MKLDSEFVNALEELSAGERTPLFSIRLSSTDGTGKLCCIGLQELATTFRQAARAAYRIDDDVAHRLASNRANLCENIFDTWNARDPDGLRLYDTVAAVLPVLGKIYPDHIFMISGGTDLGIVFTLGPKCDDNELDKSEIN